MRVGLIQFPGSNCDEDCRRALAHTFGFQVTPLWHEEKSLPAQLDFLVIPGGFSYGDYVRSGVLAARSPILNAVKDFAQKGGPVIGICNGFQILTEAKLLPGALIQNASGKFVSKSVRLKRAGSEDEYLLPVAHGEGRFFAGENLLKRLKDHGQIAYRYTDDVNGSEDRIAGITSENRRVLGLMPHPERAMKREIHGSSDGEKVWRQFFDTALKGVSS